MIRLTMDIDKEAADFADNRLRDRAPVNPRAAPSGRPNLAAQDDFVVLRLVQQIARIKIFVHRGANRRILKRRFDNRAILAGSDHFNVGLPAKHRRQRVQNDRFSRPGLSGQHVQSVTERYVQRGYQREFLDRQSL